MLKYLKFRFNKSVNKKVAWEGAVDVRQRLLKLSSTLELDYLDLESIHCCRSYNSKARAYARIWGLGRLWQMVLSEKPTYVIEVISEKYDSLDNKEKDKVILHEIAHIPKNFSGSLVPHIRKRGARNFNDKVSSFVRNYLNKINL